MAGYDKSPAVRVEGHDDAAVCGWQRIVDTVRKARQESGKNRFILTIDCYPGVLYDELDSSFIQPLQPDAIFFVDDAIMQSAQQITARVKERLTDDRVFGQMCLETYGDLVDSDKLAAAQHQLSHQDGLVVVYGCGARLLAEPDLYLYADMARWELQCRFRKGLIPDWKCSMPTQDNLVKFKWGYFFAWRVADRHKKRWFEQVDFFLDTNTQGQPKLVRGDALRDGLRQTARQPFRVVPFFDPGVWGGQWMKRACDLPKETKNYAWCFDCVPEENSLLLTFGDVTVEIPSIDLVFYQPVELLGKRVYARFGAEFPIRFDFLDTIGGQNLSLQVHPDVTYIQEHFGMHYTQEESYYILDAEEDAAVYLGVKNGVRKEELMEALAQAQTGKERFEDEKYINRFPVRKHDHVLIPPGTIHCSGNGTMVLEISATPYIFTFKLWDWGRLGLDGKPRPIHLEHGQEVIRIERDTDFAQRELVNAVTSLDKTEARITERTGLHELEWIESRREWFDQPIACETHGSVNVLNLVEGASIRVCSPDNAFEPFVVHYAETFIIPESVGRYLLCPLENGDHKKSEEAKKSWGVVIARVRV